MFIRNNGNNNEIGQTLDQIETTILNENELKVGQYWKTIVDSGAIINFGILLNRFRN